MAQNMPTELRTNADILGFVDQIVNDGSYTRKSTDLDRPWGGFYALENTDAEKFTNQFFPELTFDSFENLSPKLLMVAPNKRLSWQYHDRRAELWKVLRGPVGVKLSENDVEPNAIHELKNGEVIEFDAAIRHRLIGLTGVWGVVAEIWKHVNPENLSTEDDIVRVQDDFRR